MTATDVRPEDVDLPTGWENWTPHDIRRHCGKVAQRLDEIVGAHGGPSLLARATQDEATFDAEYKRLLNTKMVAYHAEGSPVPIAKARAEADEETNAALLDWQLAVGQRRAIRDELEALRAVLSGLQTLFRDVMRQAGR